MTPGQDISSTENTANCAFNLALLSQCWPGMTPSQSLRDVLGRAGALKPYEAVAIAQQLIASSNIDVDPPLLSGPLSLDKVRVGADGAVACNRCTVSGVSAIGVLLAEMLPSEGTTRVPGALRYTIARALSQVEAPPFDSLSELSAALARHEQGDRVDVVRNLFVRAASKPPTCDATDVDRRRRTPSAAALRRQLREADEELFYHLTRTVTSPAAPPPAPSGRDAVNSFTVQPEAPHTAAARGGFTAVDWAVGSTVALLIAFGAGYTVVAGLRAGTHLERPGTSAAKPGPQSTAVPMTDAGRQPLRTEETSTPDTAPSGKTRFSPSPRPLRQ